MYVINLILTYLFGQKYYINIYNRRGSTLCECSSRIHKTYQAARVERLAVMDTISFLHVDIVSFRTKQPIPQTYDDLDQTQRKEYNV